MLTNVVYKDTLSKENLTHVIKKRQKKNNKLFPVYVSMYICHKIKMLILGMLIQALLWNIVGVKKMSQRQGHQKYWRGVRIRITMQNTGNGLKTRISRLIKITHLSQNHTGFRFLGVFCLRVFVNLTSNVLHDGFKGKHRKWTKYLEWWRKKHVDHLGEDKIQLQLDRTTRKYCGMYLSQLAHVQHVATGLH